MQIPPGQYGSGGYGGSVWGAAAEGQPIPGVASSGMPGSPPSPPPEVIEPGSARYFRPGQDYLPIFPDFTTIASKADTYARRVPWWLWLLLGFLASGWLRKRGGVKLLTGG